MRHGEKALVENNEYLKDAIDTVKQENKTLNESLRKQKEIISSQITKLEKQKLNAEKVKAKMTELEKSEEVYKTCRLCELKLESLESVTDHIRYHHCQDKESQCQELPLSSHAFHVYQCFYCNFVIKSKSDLESHIKVCCQEPTSTELTYPCDFSYTCDFCDKNCLTLGALQDHMRSNHPLPF